jgi:hypothetical protein
MFAHQILVQVAKRGIGDGLKLDGRSVHGSVS